MIHDTGKGEFHLSTQNTSYIMKVLVSGHLSTLYYGRRIREKSDYIRLYRNFALAPGGSTNYDEKTAHFTLDSTRLEAASYGKGDYREPSLSLRFEDGSRVLDCTYESHRIYNGKEPLEGLPSSFPADGESDVQTLVITLSDNLVGIKAELSYSVFSERDIITRSIRLINVGDSPVITEKLMSFNLDFPRSNFDVITLDGKWIRERHVHRAPLREGMFSIDSKKGVSSANHNPFLCLAGERTGETEGEAYGFLLVYSGSHMASAEVSPHDLLRVQMGINPFDFSWRLEAGESFQAPESLLTWSNEGLNGMSRNFHDFINHHIIPLRWQGVPRPVLLNNWEATYFDFNEQKLLALAGEAAKLGIELFVLDDGWFGKRDDDTSSLGDWFEDKKKLPGGLERLGSKIRKLGLEFGLWVEPEMVNEKSRLYEEHPDWAIKLPNRPPSKGRHQLMLDLANGEVVEYLKTTLTDLFERSGVSYVKWDMNRNLSDAYSAALPPERQKELVHRYVLGLYAILDHLKKRFPDILFESCASGGNRFDAGMLYYMPQTWTSDNTDAIERLDIQYGTSFAYPLSTMGAHVSGEPSHQVLRNTPIETRFNTAAFGLLGYELDVTKISAFDKKVITKQIEFYKEHRNLFQFGRFHRIESPFDSNRTLWMVVSEDGSEAMVGDYQKLQKPNMGFEDIRPLGLKEDALYAVGGRTQYLNIKAFGDLINQISPVKMKADGVVHTMVSNHYMFEQKTDSFEAGGDELMYAGYRLPNQFIGTGYNEQIRLLGDFGSRLYHIKEITKEDKQNSIGSCES